MKINLEALKFETDPLMEHKIMLEKSKNQEYAQMLAMNITPQIYNYFQYKVRMAENINIAIKGSTRSGKSTIGISWAKYISSMTDVLFKTWHVCSNESEYIQKVKDTERTCFNTTFLIDEQKEIGNKTDLKQSSAVARSVDESGQRGDEHFGQVLDFYKNSLLLQKSRIYLQKNALAVTQRFMFWTKKMLISLQNPFPSFGRAVHHSMCCLGI